MDIDIDIEIGEVTLEMSMDWAGTNAKINNCQMSMYGTYNVEHSVHHAWHRHGGTTATGEQQRIFGISKLAAHVGFHGLDGKLHLRPHFRGEIVGLLKDLTERSRERKARRYGNANGRHFLETEAFASQDTLVGIRNGWCRSSERNDRLYHLVLSVTVAQDPSSGFREG